MGKKRVKYIVLGFVFLGIGIVLANFFKNNVKLSINEFVLSCIAVILLLLAPYFLSESKPSKYFVLSLVFSSLSYTIIIILLIYHSNLPNYLEEIGVWVLCIILFLALIFSVISAAYKFEEFIRLFKRRD